MRKLGTCCVCDSDLNTLPSNHAEYYIASMTYNSNLRWFLCSNLECLAVCIRDKQLPSEVGWMISPDTYSRLVDEGRIPDRLS